MNKKLMDIILDDLNKSQTTAYTWVREGSFPAEACLNIEQVSHGEFTANQLRPDLFIPTHAERKLVDAVTDVMRDERHSLNDDASRIVTAIIEFFRSQNPELKDELVNKMKHIPAGQRYMSKRAVYADDKL